METWLDYDLITFGALSTYTHNGMWVDLYNHFTSHFPGPKSLDHGLEGVLALLLTTVAPIC